jgi:hypothetical protein
LYGSETWTLQQVDQNYVGRFEICRLNKMVVRPIV